MFLEKIGNIFFGKKDTSNSSSLRSDENRYEPLNVNLVQKCVICGGTEFNSDKVLWDGLVNEWELSQLERDYIDRQQGFNCKSCNGNLRAMSLAKAILTSFDYIGTFDEFCKDPQNKDIKVLEVNTACTLTKHLQLLPKHKLVEYPDYDMTNLNLETNSFDLVIHSDTLEHIDDPIKGLNECKRVLAEKGKCIFTVPIIIGRMTRSRKGLPSSYHGDPTTGSSDLLVHTEFGADFWVMAICAGFETCKIHCLEYPAGIALELE